MSRGLLLINNKFEHYSLLFLLNSNNSKIPVTSKISDKGNYIVFLMSGLPPNEFSKKSFDMELLFLNTSAPLSTKQTVPQKEPSTKDDFNLGADAFLIQPGVIKSTVPTDSYDITIYSTNGKVLWKKVNQPVTAGRGFERVTFANGYSGGITIQLTNIKSGSIVTKFSNIYFKSGSEELCIVIKKT